MISPRLSGGRNFDWREPTSEPLAQKGGIWYNSAEMCMLDEVRAKRDEIYSLAKKHKAEKLWVFGSCARKEETPESDVDFLVKLGGATLFDMSDLQEGLERILGRDVDLVSEKVLRDDFFGRQVMKERIAV